MQYFHELVRSDEGFPFKAFIHSVSGLDMHWHNEMEIILVLQGSVNIRIANEEYFIKENDLILINSNEIHNTNRTEQENTLLALQIDMEHYSSYYPGINNLVFDCKSFLFAPADQGRFNLIRHYLAKVVWELNKKKKGYQFTVNSEINLLLAHLLNNIEQNSMEDDKATSLNRDIDRLKRIISYINENLEKNVTLKEIADRQELNPYYLSHFIKDKLGISFRSYLNNIRIDRARSLLSNSNATITEIAYASGYPSTKSLNKHFRDAFGCTPSQYRTKNNLQVIKSQRKAKSIAFAGQKSRTYLDVDRNAALEKLYTYLAPADGEILRKHLAIAPSAHQAISANVQREGVPLAHYWKRLTTFSRAAEGLRWGWQKQLKEVQEEIGFEYIRFHGIFSDEMMVCNLDEDGNITYNWSYVDELFDFFQKVKIKPFVELGFMPSELKKTDETTFWWRANISRPREIGLWTELVIEFLKHCINRYGLKEVESWYFEVWNQPDLEHVFWIGGKEAYFEFYRETAVAIKSISERLKVGGPAITHQGLLDGNWLDDFLLYLRKNALSLDFISIHIYPEDFSPNEEIQDLLLRAKEGEELAKLQKCFVNIPMIYNGEHHTLNTLDSTLNKMYQHEFANKELHITEWNASAYSRNLIHDTCFVATFIISNILACIGKTTSIGYWTFTDINEETKAGISAFHGGFGLINNQGLKKSSYYAYYLLSKLGEEIIDQGEDYIITKNEFGIQILAYNYAYFDDLFINGDTSLLTALDRYSVFEAKPIKEFKIELQEISGNYKVTRYELNREHGSVFDEWVNMGHPENMTQEELDYLKGRAHPKVTIEYLELDGVYEKKLYIPVHGVELITLEKHL